MKKSLIIYSLTTLLVISVSDRVTAENQMMAGKQSRHGGHLSRFIDKFDSNQDGLVSEEEFSASIDHRFMTMDVDNDGRVTEDEFSEHMQAKHKDIRQARIEKLDSDQDGLISEQEFVDAMLKKAKKRFVVMDEDQDGFLDDQEYKKKHGRFKKPGHYFPKLDINGDGTISADENKVSSLRMFLKLDKNKDNVISAEEVMHKRHRRKGTD